MTKVQQYRLFKLPIILTFLFTTVGLVAYAYLQAIPRNTNNPESLVVLVDSFNRKSVLEDIETNLQSLTGIVVDSEPIRSNWLTRAGIIGTKAPRVVIAHFHALRYLNGKGHYESEEDLILGLSRIRKIVPSVFFVIYSSGFDNT